MCPRTRLLLVILLCACRAAAAEPKRDRHGDPLPEGAIARLGSLRLRTEQPIVAAAFTADGKTLAACEGNSISFWDPVTGKALRRLSFKTQLWRLSADGKMMVSSRPDKPNLLFFVDVSNGVEHRPLNHAQCGFIQVLDVSRDGKILAAVHQGSIAVWDVPGGKLLHEFKGPPIVPLSPTRTIALTPDGKQLVLPHSDSSLHLLDVATGKELRAFEMPPMPPGRHPSQRLQRLTLSPDSRYLAFAGPATPLTVCELATGKRLRELAPPQGIISGLAFTPNGRFLAVDEYTRIRLFGVLSGKEMRKLPVTTAMRNVLVFSPDGRTLATVGGHTINLWDMAAQRPLHPPVGHEAAVQAMAFFPDGKRLVSADSNSGVMVWDIASGRSLAQRRNNTTPVSLAVDGDSVRFAGYDVAVHRWDLRTGREESQALLTGLSTNMLALSPDGRSLAVQTFNNTSRQLWLYDLKNNKSMMLPGLPPQSWIGQMVFTPDSRRLAANGHDGVLRLWDRDTTKLVQEFKRETPGGQPTHLAFAADGRSLALIDGMVRLREIFSGADRLRIPLVAGSSLFALAYSPDARFLACGQADGTITVYSAATGKQLAQWQGKQGAVRALAFSGDSRLLASGGDNGTILVWKVPKDETLPAALTAEKAVSLWEALGDHDAAAANRALAALTAAPAQTLPLFKEHLRPLGSPLDRKRLARLIAELDDDSFKVRERATRELAIAGADAADALRQALHNDPSVEAKRRIEDLLSRLKNGSDSQRLRFLRAVEVLERIGTPQARELLRELAGKPMAAQLEAEVQASLRRLGERQKLRIRAGC